uniref:G-protein coupled receptors family 1 profile domain-containing protein n=1 Tax=Strigamia maritima TaxID=126957 RepID=T1J193_STRMM
MDDFWQNATHYDEVYEDIPHDTQSHDSLFQLITNGILLTFVATLGILGNVISIIVLAQPQMRSSINCCFIALATFDTSVLIAAILMCGLRAIPAKDFEIYHLVIFPTLMPWVYPFGLIAQTGSVWITVTVTAERYIAVCHPLKAKSVCTYGRARVYIILITILSIIYNLPRFWEVQKIYITHHVTNETVIAAIPTDLRRNPYFVRIYLTWLYLVVMYVVPFLCLSLLNVFIWCQVQTANRERRRLSKHQRKEISLALMLLCVVVVFFICNCLALVVNILEAFNIINDNLTQMSNLLVTVNSSVNFIIYCIFGQKFRRILQRLLCCRFCHYQVDENLEESVYPMPSFNTDTKPLFFSSNGTSFYSTRSKR